MTMHQPPARRASLELLRAEAADELSALIIERLRAGEDPWDFMEELPGLDELVVLLLRAERSPVRPSALSAAENFRILRQIAMDYPALSAPVWVLLGANATVAS